MTDLALLQLVIALSHELGRQEAIADLLKAQNAAMRDELTAAYREFGHDD